MAMKRIWIITALLLCMSVATGNERRFSYDPANADPDGIADALTTGTDWSLSGDSEWLLSSAGDLLAHRLIATTAGDEPANNDPLMTFTGTDADGNVITDTVTLPNATTVESSEYFLTVTSATTGANATVGTVDVGWVDEFVSQSIKLDGNYQSNWQINLTGTISIDTDWLVKDRLRPPLLSEQNVEPWLDGSGVQAALDAETGDSSLAVVVLEGYKWMRFRVNSYTDTAEFDVYFTQKEVRQPR